LIYIQHKQKKEQMNNDAKKRVRFVLRLKTKIIIR